MATRRNRKSGRFSKTTRSRRRKSFSIGKAAETALVANAAITGIFGTNLPTFLVGKNVLGGFGANGANNSWEITLGELGNMLMGGKGGVADSFGFDGSTGLTAAVRKNIKDNGFNSLVSMVTIPIAFKVGRKLLAKPLINPTNRMLKSVGLKEVKL